MRAAVFNKLTPFDGWNRFACSLPPVTLRERKLFLTPVPDPKKTILPHRNGVDIALQANPVSALVDKPPFRSPQKLRART
jgi:hypothetical protein